MSVELFYSEPGIVLYCARWEDVLPLPGYDVVATDPPYGTGGWRREESGNGSDPSASLVVEEWDDGGVDWLAAVAPTPTLTFWPPARTSHLLNAARACGLTKHRALYLRKPDPKPQVGGRVKWSVEPVWVLSEDGFLLYGGDDVWEASTPRRGQAENVDHPYQKPLSFMLWLLQKLPGRTPLDLFAGSGTTLVAAKMLGMRAVGIEERADYCAMAADRLRHTQVLPLLFSPHAPPQETLSLEEV